MRPMNIRTLKISSPKSLSCPVTPIDKPTVPKAETTSNAKGRNGSDSEIVKRKMKIHTVKIEIVVMASERIVISMRIERPKISGSLCERRNASVDSTTTMNVVSLMPDAVDALPPPMNIRIIVSNKVGSSMTL